MYPLLFELGSFVLPTWHVLFVGGAIGAYIVLQYLRKHFLHSISDTDLRGLFVVGYIGGYLGARSLSIALEDNNVESVGDFFAALATLGAMTFYGGFLGSTAAIAFFVWIKKLSGTDVFDMCMCAGMLGLALGRIGCFLNGDDYGIAVLLNPDSLPPWWAVTFPNHKNPVPRYPVQLYEAFFAGGLAILGIYFFRKLRSRNFRGIVGCLLAGSYAIFRFIIEFLRGDSRGELFTSALSPSQIISIFVLLAVVAIFAANAKEKSRRLKTA